MTISSVFKFLMPGSKEKDPKHAYDLWAAAYDQQPGNLMLDFDEMIFAELLSLVSINEKRIVDIGCGTGRHWNKIKIHNPRELIGYDVSDGMLQVLNKKFPGS